MWVLCSHFFLVKNIATVFAFQSGNKIISLLEVADKEEKLIAIKKCVEICFACVLPILRLMVWKEIKM